MKEEYKNLYCNAHIYFLLKTLNIKIESDIIVSHDNVNFYISDNKLLDLDCAYKPSVFEIFKYIKENYKLIICINKHDNEWEWLIKDQNNIPIVYSGETKLTTDITYNMGKNIPENREYYSSELLAIEDAISELLLLI